MDLNINEIDKTDENNENVFKNIFDELNNIKTNMKQKNEELINNLNLIIEQNKKQKEELENENNILKQKNIEIEKSINLIIEQNKVEKEQINKKLEEINKENNLIKEKNKEIEEKLKLLLEQNIIQKNNSISLKDEQKKNDIKKDIIEVSNNKEQVEKNEIILEKEKPLVKEVSTINVKEDKILKGSDAINHFHLGKNFRKKPQHLKVIDTLVSNTSKNEATIRQVAVYTGLTDNIDYLAYSSDKVVYIIKITGKKIEHSLTDHRALVSVIQYYIKNSKEEYLFTCDTIGKVALWDIQDNYTKKYHWVSNCVGPVYNAAVFFNVFGYNYVVVSSSNQTEYSQVLRFGERIKFYKYIDRTKSPIKYMLPWTYDNKYYAIDLCFDRICINSILDDENFGEFNPGSKQYFGCIYKDIYLYCSKLKNITIYDLVNRHLIKKFTTIYNPRSIVFWSDDIFIAVSSQNSNFHIMDNKNKTELKSVYYKNCNGPFSGLKKIKLNNFDESLIAISSDGKIYLLGFN